MAFRKRNIGLSRSTANDSPQAQSLDHQSSPGVRPSYQDSRPTTSTGSASLDGIFGGHAGLPLGNSILIEESGTTDFASALLRYYAAEGVVHQHQIHLVGVPIQWARDLPGLTDGGRQDRSRPSDTSGLSKDKMRIAWRYERLGEFGAGSRVPTQSVRNSATSSSDIPSTSQPERFCHSYDLSKRLSVAPSPPIHCVALPTIAKSFATTTIAAVRQEIQASPAKSIHRIVVPSFLSPAFYPPEICSPTIALPFFHALRALLHDFPRQVTAMISLPLTLHPRTTGLVRWLEHLSDGVIELAPFPPDHEADPPPAPSKTDQGDVSTSKREEKAQGALKVHKIPVWTARGQGSGAGDDMAFSLGRTQFSIMKYHLPPVEGDLEAQQAKSGDGQTPKSDLEF